MSSIDLDHEHLLTLGQASKYLPRRRGKAPAATTVWRWIVKGWRGVRLEAMRTPAGWVTSVEAIQRFLTALANLDRAAADRDLRAEMEAAKRRSAWTDEVLRQHGIVDGKKDQLTNERTRP